MNDDTSLQEIAASLAEIAESVRSGAEQSEAAAIVEAIQAGFKALRIESNVAPQITVQPAAVNPTPVQVVEREVTRPWTELRVRAVYDTADGRLRELIVRRGDAENG